MSYYTLNLFLFLFLSATESENWSFCNKEVVGLQVPEVSATSKTRVQSCEEQA